MPNFIAQRLSTNPGLASLDDSVGPVIELSGIPAEEQNASELGLQARDTISDDLRLSEVFEDVEIQLEHGAGRIDVNNPIRTQHVSNPLVQQSTSNERNTSQMKQRATAFAQATGTNPNPKKNLGRSSIR